MSCTHFNFKRPISRRVLDYLFTWVISLFIGPRNVVWMLMRASLIFVSVQVNAIDINKAYQFDIPAQSLVKSLVNVGNTWSPVLTPLVSANLVLSAS